MVYLFSHPTYHTVEYIRLRMVVIYLFSHPTYLCQVLQQLPYVQLHVMGDGIVCLFSHPTYLTVENPRLAIGIVRLFSHPTDQADEYITLVIVCLFSHPTDYADEYITLGIEYLFSHPTYLCQILQQLSYVQLRVMADGIVYLFSHPTSHTVEYILYVYSHTLHTCAKSSSNCLSCSCL